MEVLYPKSKTYTKRCTIRFTSEFVDTAGLEMEAVDAVISATQRQSTTTIPATSCAFLGAFRATENIASALYTSLKGYTQVSTLTSAPELDNKDIYPLYGSLNPSSPAIPFLQFLIEVLGIQHLAVVYPDNASGYSWINPLQQAAKEHFPSFVIKGVGYIPASDNFEAAVALLKATGFRYIYSVANTNDFAALITEAHKQGIAGSNTNDHTWITWVGIPVTFYLGKSFSPTDPFFLTASKGMILFDSTVRSIPGVGRYNEFLQSRSQLSNPHDLAYLQSKVPQHDPFTSPDYNPIFTNDTVSQIGRFTGASSALYDATIALGLGACAAAEAAADKQDSKRNTFDGSTHFQGFMNVSFVGATGRVELDPTTGSRRATSTLYAVTNMVPIPMNDGSGNMTFQEVKTHYYNDEQWLASPEQIPITFGDGSQTPHSDLPPESIDSNLVGTSLRVVGLVMVALVLVASVACALWTFQFQQKRIVMASQPIFLLLICVGTFLMGSSIIPLSLDDDIVSSDKGLDSACQAIPWLLSLGWCVSFSALFSKTKRINTIFHNPTFRRVKVDAVDVIKPMMVLLIVNIVILGTWTGLSPMTWERNVTMLDAFGRPSESVGQCTSDNFWHFAAPLIVIDLGALVYAMQQANVARKIATEFSESEWIARGMSFIMLVAFVTIPVLIIAEDDVQASYFVECALVFVVCMSLLGFIFGPKMLAGQLKYSTNESIQTTIRNISNGRSSQVSRSDVVDACSNSDQEGGALILEHPKMNEELREQVKSLKRANMELEKEIVNLKGKDNAQDNAS